MYVNSCPNCSNDVEHKGPDSLGESITCPYCQRILELLVDEWYDDETDDGDVFYYLQETRD